MRWVLVLGFAAIGLVGTASGATQSATQVAWAEPTWSPDGKSIALTGHPQTGGDVRIYLVRPDGTGLRALTSGRRYASSPTWSPDSRRIAYGSEAGIDLVHRDGTGHRTILDHGIQPAWSPRGRRIAFDWAPDDAELGPGYIYAIKPDGTDEAAVYDKEDGYHSYFAPTWSPDGQRLAFSAGVRGDNGFEPKRHWIGVVHQYRGKPKIYARGLNPSDIDWGPRGRTIAFSNYAGRLFTVDLRTGHVRKLGRGMHPTWSPDGRRIAFADKSSVYVENANGTHRRLILAATS